MVLTILALFSETALVFITHAIIDHTAFEQKI